MCEIICMKPTPIIVLDKELRQMDYPVGGNYNNNIPVFDRMTVLLASHIPINTKEVHFWVRGSSGTITASAICGRLLRDNPTLNVLINVISKTNESRHSGGCYSFKSHHDGFFNVIVDDFISSGETLRSIYRGIIDTTNVSNPIIDLLLITGTVEESKISTLNIRKIISTHYEHE